MATATDDMRGLANDDKTCPHCGAVGRWRCIPTRRYLSHKCFACGKTNHAPLPVFSKKVIYLDQLVISNFVKAKDPYWPELLTRLEQLIGSQLVACPYSPLHAEESMLKVDLDEALQAMYKSLGGRDRWKSPDDIRLAQLSRSLEAYLSGQQTDSSKPPWADALDENPHFYTGDMTANVIMAHHPMVVESVRREKFSLYDALKQVRDYRKDNPKSFDDDVDAEGEAFAESLISAHRDAEKRLIPTLAPAVRLVDALVYKVGQLHADASESLKLVHAFLRSAHLRRTAFLDIGCRLWASIAQNERNPKGSRQPDPGDSYDVDMLSHYAPYCDAMFIDNEFRGMATDNKIDETYGVQLFSSGGEGRSDFLSYLDGIKSAATREHWDKVAECDPDFAVLWKRTNQNNRVMLG